MRQGRDTRLLLFADLSRIVFALLLILLLGSMQCPQFAVPVGLEGISWPSLTASRSLLWKSPSGPGWA